MNKTDYTISSATKSVDTEGLKNMLCCGKTTAVKIGTAAGAKVVIGRRVLWNLSIIQKYLDEIRK